MAALEVELLHMYVLDNAKNHHTDKYEVVHQEPPVPVLRRAEPFYLCIRFASERIYSDHMDVVKLVFTYGDKPHALLGTKGTATLTSRGQFTDDKTRWEVILTSDSGDDLSLMVRSPVNAPVGAWNLEVQTSLKSYEPGEFNSYKFSESIFLLFNPWHPSDKVYMPEQQLMDEYVLNDVGKIWVGTKTNASGREWVFGQFDAVVLPAVMMVLERSSLSGLALGDPIRLSRALSKLVNSNDDQGVITGRWDGDYADATSPSAWTGSVPILEEFLSTGSQVSYGQCWVFSGVLTTIARSLGIPSRVVTNFASAHDDNDSLTVDRYYSADTEEIPYDPRNPMGEDSIWNFHVWNEVWMTRPDLPSGYGGWQVVDATPQITSDGQYQCGPASVEAVHRGEVGLRYDVGYVLAAVNADLIRWKQDPNAEDGYSQIDCNTYHVGKMLLTKRAFVFDPLGDTDKEDITHQYKAKEGSEHERSAFYLAAQRSRRAKRFLDVPSLVSSELEELDTINIGENFVISIKLKNGSDEARTIQAAVSARSIYYNGAKAHLIKKASGVFKLKPKSHKFLRLKVKAAEYLDKLVEYSIIKLYAITTVIETRQTWAGEDDFQVTKPPLQVKIKPTLSQGQPVKIGFKFKNPLNKQLHDSKFFFEGPHLCKSTKVNCRNIRPEEDVRHEVTFTPMFPGEHKLVATFDSKELSGITGFTDVFVSEK